MKRVIQSIKNVLTNNEWSNATNGGSSVFIIFRKTVINDKEMKYYINLKWYVTKHDTSFVTSFSFALSSDKRIERNCPPYVDGITYVSRSDKKHTLIEETCKLVESLYTKEIEELASRACGN